MRLVRLLLFPFSLLYALAIVLRNMAYDYKILKSYRFQVPVILVGNLTVGGTGKSPMIAYLVKKIKSKHQLAVLSRGYGRVTTGFIVADSNATSQQIGDEPLQLKKQFPELTVAVCEDRVQGINQLMTNHSLILMDDGYQHRAVTPGLSILLFDYHTLNSFQWFLPTGNLREPMSGIKRANVIMVTKSPQNITAIDRKRCIAAIKPFAHQQVFFSYLTYGNLKSLNNAPIERNLESITSSTHIILLTGIANADPLLQKIKEYSDRVDHHHYPDHYQFNKKDMLKLSAAYSSLHKVDKLIITTEKDAQRLNDIQFKELIKNLFIYYIPVQVEIHQSDKENFDNLIETYVAESSTRNNV